MKINAPALTTLEANPCAFAAITHRIALRREMPTLPPPDDWPAQSARDLSRWYAVAFIIAIHAALWAAAILIER